ncbi:hypothetical protein F8154_13070 [Alkaliphilus pronyensis]|uniref:Signal transduction histidine kinase osmosensitive K+ channel sensor N-terminal domain-containing protein n=1 Tax=Alkaliphilus pronyensis TaxID=1482732 RepID=A0A6I0F272_9FIRM|nr:hypothetical protein [Alkaliphilus pronyensis]KAB3531291.1 hypothetical protein F8154_13070 [Alkaliphilus pronyensis]
MSKKQKGDLYLFVSYAPGVGKTYHMVKFAQQREIKGDKVCYAHIYDGHRDDINGKCKYSIKEILHENPDLVVLDELVMRGRNVDDSSKGVRDDAEALLEMGIDVCSTVNLLHFSYVNKACKDKTGFQVKEPLSNDLLIKSKEIVYIDCYPEILEDGYINNVLFTKIKKSPKTDNIFNLENLKLFRLESINLLKKFDNVTWKIRRLKYESPKGKKDEEST